MAYTAEIIRSNRELSKKERVMYKDASDCKRLDEETSLNGRIRIKPVLWLELAVHNDKAKDNKDYSQFIIVDTDGQAYLTGSQNFYNNFLGIASEMDGEEFEIEVYRRPSKNYNGKEFLTCKLV
jgi:hypothetical protein